jgi:hypothetical protein
LMLWIVRREQSGRLLLMLVLTLLFCVGTALLTALGRLHLGLVQAFTSRYQTVALLYWCDLGLLSLVAFRDHGFARRLVLIAQVCLLCILVRGAYLARYPIRQARWHGFQLNAAGAAMVTAVNDPRQLYYAGADLADIAMDINYLRQRQLSVFADSAYSWVGKPLLSISQLAPPNRCSGELQSAAILKDDRDPGNLRLSGWAWDLHRRQPPSFIVTVIEGKVAGVGALGDWRPTVRAAHPYMKTSFIGFTAYVKGAEFRPPAEVYAVLPGDPPQVCPIAAVRYSDVK